MSDNPGGYPDSIKQFDTYQDQPGPDDKTIIYAQITNEIDTEVVEIEEAMGARAYTVPGVRTLGASISWLYNNKADLSHWHRHHLLPGENGDDHPQYVRTNGTRGFNQPVASPRAYATRQLARLDQVQQHSPAISSDYVTETQMFYILQLALNAGLPTSYPSTDPRWLPAAGHTTGFGWGTGITWLWGPSPQENSEWQITGGWAYGFTDNNGSIYVDFHGAFTYMVLTFQFMKMPVPGGSHYGYTYRYEEDQLSMESITNQGAWIRFSEDNAIDRQAWVSFSWLALGL